jgi:hypothetical protein
MTRTTTGRAAFILAIGLLAGIAGPSRAAETTARDNVGVSIPTNGSGAQPAPTAEAAGANPLSDSDRAARADDVKQPMSVTQTETPAPRVGPVVAGQNTSWDQTSLIGKIFIGFGALLTIASAARMFMA